MSFVYIIRHVFIGIFCLSMTEAQHSRCKCIDEINEIKLTVTSISKSFEEAITRLDKYFLRSDDCRNIGKTQQENFLKLIENMLPNDCRGAFLRGTIDPIVKVKIPNLDAREVKCDFNTDGGGWTVIVHRNDQKLSDPSLYMKNEIDGGDTRFNRSWNDYKNGFGNPRGDYWIGNEVLHALTKHGSWEAMVIIKSWNNAPAFAKYGHFMVLSEKEKYTLKIDKYYAGSTAGNSLKYHDNQPFSTFDQENEKYERFHCAHTYGAGWWFNKCHTSLLTGKHKGSTGCIGSDCCDFESVHWKDWKHGCNIKEVTMMIRPKA